MEVCVREAKMETCQDLVSVIVPIFNMEEHLDRCLESILGQTYRNIEILLIDDGSTDSSLEIMIRYAGQDPRIRVFHKENGGVSSARNMGLEEMRGAYCTFVDPDDYIAKVYVEWLLAGIKEHDADLSICGFCTVAPGKGASFPDNNSHPSIIDVPISEYTFWNKKYRSVPCVSVCACYEKKLVENLRFDEAIYIGEDTLFFTSCIMQSKKCVRVVEGLYAYVQYSHSASHQGFSPKKWTILDAWIKTISQVENGPVELYRSAVAYYIINCSLVLIDMIHSSYNDSKRVQFLIGELRKNRRAIAYIPREKLTIRIRVAAAVVFPRLTSHILWYQYLLRRNVLDNLSGMAHSNLTLASERVTGENE